MRVNQRTTSCECITIHQDELCIASNTLQDILHIVKEKYEIKINQNNYLESNFPHNPGGTSICQLKEYLEKLYANVNMLLNDKLLRDLHIAFEMINFFIRKGNQNLIHIKNRFQHINDLSRQRKLDKLYNEV